MEIRDRNGKVLESYDPAEGYAERKEETIRHEAAAFVPEEGHYETVAEYENGGRDVAWVVDKPGVEAREAYEETVSYLLYTPYTEAEKAARARAARISELKTLLASTDYAVIKIAEGAAAEEEYAEVIERRKSWRGEINALEKEGE